MRAGSSLRLVRDRDRPPERVLARQLTTSCFFSGKATIACAVSGGADSLALLVLAAEAGLKPVAYHVDHGLRPGSAGEVELVRRAASLLGAEVVSLKVELRPGPNLEARAHEARFAVLPSDVATGHTADDQAETVLINLLRGSAAAGLSAMKAGPRHPILSLRRSDTRAVCQEAGLSWFEDPSNDEPGPLRNRVRHDLIPQLNELSGRDLVPVLCRQAELLGDDEALLEELSRALDPSSTGQLKEAPLPLSRRAVRRLLREASEGSHPPSLAAVERVLNVAEGKALACDVSGGVAVRRQKGRLVVTRRAAPDREDT